MKAQMGIEVKFYSYFNLGARWGGWLTLHLSLFTPRNDPVSIVQEFGCASGPDRRRNTSPYRDSISVPSNPQQVAKPTTPFRPLILKVSYNVCLIRTNKMQFSILIYFNNLFSTRFEKSNYSSSGSSYCMCSMWCLHGTCVHQLLARSQFHSEIN